MQRTSEPLADKTTMRVGGRARHFVQAHDRHALRAHLAHAEATGVRVFVLGGGSNLVVADGELDALVVQPRFDELHIEPDADGRPQDCLVTADAGLSWDALTLHCAERGLWGIESLSGIPGSVGAAPVQNIGAYGQSLSDTLQAVELQPIEGGDAFWQPASALQLGYRTSVLKREPGRFVVTGVCLRLTSERPREPGVRLEATEASHPLAIRREVLEVRQQKGMLWHGAGNPFGTVGSFFVNPVVSRAQAEALQARFAACPLYPAADGKKLAAAWLIEAAGLFKGHVFEETGGRVGLSPQHALSLINRGGASADDILTAARLVAKRVHQEFAVSLAPEARFVGFPGAALECPAAWPPRQSPGSERG